jgi:hypothetical protein
MPPARTAAPKEKEAMASANATAKAEAVIKKAAGEAQAQTPRRSLAKRTGEPKAMAGYVGADARRESDSRRRSPRAKHRMQLPWPSTEGVTNATDGLARRLELDRVDTHRGRQWPHDQAEQRRHQASGVNTPGERCADETYWSGRPRWYRRAHARVLEYSVLGAATSLAWQHAAALRCRYEAAV